MEFSDADLDNLRIFKIILLLLLQLGGFFCSHDDIQRKRLGIEVRYKIFASNPTISRMSATKMTIQITGP